MRSLDDVQPPSPSQLCDESADSSDGIYVPQVNRKMTPKFRQQFGNLDEALNFYNNYAREAGFSVRINSNKTGKDGDTNVKEYVCCNGWKRTNSEATTWRQGLTGAGCRAKLTVMKKRSGEGFVVSQFVEGHNHPLSRKVHLLKSQCRVSDAQKSLTQQPAATNPPTCQQMSILELQSGGLENVGLQRDLYNTERDRRKLYGVHDANMLYEYFEAEKQKNPGFVFAMERDDEGRMTHCFWADAMCRKSYEYFGDVVVFDTAYNTNRYSLIFAPILGVNHHGHATLFGCAFLNDETTDSFEWLFEEWLKAMPAGPPEIIITDQDPAMTKAIACALPSPSTFHRYCIWHIVNKFPEKIGALAYKEHFDEFKNCIWNSDSPEEFEARWADVVGKSNLSNNEWLQAMYKIRDRWIPAYTRHIFSAQMTSNQRAKISHSFFKRYVSKENSFMDFVMRFNRALSHIRQNELDLDFKDVNEKLFFKTAWPLEKRMSKLYTRHIFYKLQEEVFQVGAYMVKKRHEDEHWCVWNVQRVALEGSSSREVSVDKLTDYARCSCKMFEFDGIPCRHMLAYLARMQFMELPAQYILERWTNAAKAGRVLNDGGSCVKEVCDFSVEVRRQGIFPFACNVVDDAILNEEGTEILREALLSAQKKIALMRSSREAGSKSRIQVSISLGSQRSFEEALQDRAKCCGKRLKGEKEKAVKKGRKCNGCGLTGQSHDKRNCPKLHNMSSQDVRLDDYNDV